MGSDRIGRYRIEEHLGRGGMGEVYKAWDERLGRWVALKSLHPGRELDPLRRAQLRHEARAVAALSHPAIAQIHDIMTRGERDYLVLEYVEGDNLATQIRERKLSLLRAMSLANNIAKGLYTAHTRGIVHRDLKAANIIVTPNGQAKILDFGLAKLESPVSTEEAPHERPGELVGTLNAMSPEQVLRKSVDHRSDLFSLGTLLYEMITHVHPFRGTSPLDSIHRITQVTPASPHKLNPKVPLAVSQLVSRLLEKDPDRRPQTAMEVVRVLERELESEHEQTADLPRFNRPGARRRLATAAAATLVIAAAAVAGWQLNRNPAELPPHYVAVLQPAFIGGEPDEYLDVIASAVHVASVNALSAHNGVFAISPGPLDTGSRSPQEIGRAVAADEVLVIELENPGGGFYQLTASWIVADGGFTRWMDAFQVPARDLQLLFDTVAAHTRRAYPDREVKQATPGPSARPEDYEAFFRVKQLLAERRTPLPLLLTRLESIRQSSPGLLSAYSLEIGIARYLFESEKDETILERAKATLQEAIRIAPDDPRVIIPAIDLAITGNDLERAARHLGHLEQVAPMHPACTTFRAKIADRQGRPDEAIAVLKQRIEHRPSWHLLRNLGTLEMRTGHIDQARSHLMAALDLAPGHPDLLSMLAELEFAHGDLNRAEELFLNLTANNPSRFNQSQVAAIRLFRGRYQEARDILQRLVDEGSQHPLDLLNLADCHKMLGDELEAQKIYTELARLAAATGRHKTVQNLEIAAQALAHLGEHRAAIRTIDEALRHSPESAKTLFAATVVYAVIDDRASAQATAQRALEVGLNPEWLNLPWLDDILQAN